MHLSLCLDYFFLWQSYFTNNTFAEEEILEWDNNILGVSKFSQCNDIDFVGGKGKAGNDTIIKKIIEDVPQHYKLRIQFTLNAIELWDQVDNLQVLINEHKLKKIKSNHAGYTISCSEYYKSRISSYEVEIYHSESSFELKFLGALDEDLDNEAFSIRDIKIYISECKQNCEQIINNFDEEDTGTDTFDLSSWTLPTRPNPLEWFHWCGSFQLFGDNSQDFPSNIKKSLTGLGNEHFRIVITFKLWQYNINNGDYIVYLQLTTDESEKFILYDKKKIDTEDKYLVSCAPGTDYQYTYVSIEFEHHDDNISLEIFDNFTQNRLNAPWGITNFKVYKMKYNPKIQQISKDYYDDQTYTNWVVTGENAFFNSTLRTIPLLGGNNQFGQGSLQKTWTGLPTHTKLIFSFRIFFFNLWDTEDYIIVYADQVHTLKIGKDQLNFPYIHTHQDSQMVYFEIPHFRDEVFINIQSYQDEAKDNEAWGVRDLVLIAIDEQVNYYQLQNQELTSKNSLNYSNFSLIDAGTNTSICQDFQILGGVDNFAQNSSATININSLPQHQMLIVYLTLYTIDSWDSSDHFYAQVDDYYKSVFLGHERDNIPRSYLCGNSADIYLHSDNISILKFIFPHNLTNAKIEFGAQLDETPDNESWGIRDIAMFTHIDVPYCQGRNYVLNVGESCQSCPLECKSCEYFTESCILCSNHYGQYCTQQCDDTKCIQCGYNRVNNTPDCPCEYPALNTNESNQQGWCNDCSIVVLKKVQMSNNLKSISAQFYQKIQIKDMSLEDSKQESNELCQKLFSFSDNQVGVNPMCSLNSAEDTLIINLGHSSSIIIGQQIQLNPGNIQYQDTSGVCSSSDYFNEFKLTDLIIDINNAKQPYIKSSYPMGSLTLCQEIQIQILNTFNDGLRDLKNYRWGIESTNSSDTTNIDEIIQQANQNQQTFLIIPSLTLQEFSTYKFSLYYENFVGKFSTDYFDIETRSYVGAYANIIKDKQFLFKTFQDIEVQADIAYLNCQSGKIEIVPNRLQVEWKDKVTNQIVKSYQSEQTDTKSEYKIDPFIQNPGTYQLQVKVYSDIDPQSFGISQVEYQVEKGDLVVQIEGGNRMQAYSKKLNITGKVRNPNVQKEFQQQGININWECLDLITSLPCTYLDQNPVVFNSTSLEQTFGEKKFVPYNSYQFKLEGDKPPDLNNSNIVTIVIVEVDLPLLTVNLPERVNNQKVNKNDDIFVDISYEGDPDNAFYSLIIIYDFDIVATKTFQFNQFSFKIWDLYNDFRYEKQDFLLKVSLYDPQYFMPSQTSFNVKLNFEPQEGELKMKINKGIGFKDIFEFEVVEVYDEDQPLSYKFQIYKNEKDFKEDRQLGENSVTQFRTLLQDYQVHNMYQGLLPQCDLNQENNKHECIIMVSVKDSLNAIRNFSDIIEVNPPLEMNLHIQSLQENLNLSKELQINEKFLQISLLAQELYQLNSTVNNQCKQEDNGQCNGQGSCINDENDNKNDGENQDSNNYCLCNDGFYLNQCNLNGKNSFDSYIDIKNQVYDLLNEEIENQQLDKSVQDQMLKSINLISEDPNIFKNDATKLSKQLDKIQNILNQQSELFDNNDVHDLEQQDTSKISMLIQQGSQTITKSLISLENSVQAIIQNSNQEENKVLQTQEQVYNLNEQIGSIFQKKMLPNSDKIQYKGKQLYTQYGKNTQKSVIKSFFSEQNSNNLNETSQSLNQNQYFNTNQSKVLRTQKQLYKNNPFKNEESFPYNDQNQNLVDLKIWSETENSNIEIMKDISMQFIPSSQNQQGNRRILSSDNKNKSNYQCVQRNNQKEWDSVECVTQEKEDQNGEIKYVCNCKKLNPATVVNDVKNIFANSDAKKVFSSKGFNALKSFEFHKSHLVYIYVSKFIIFILVFRELYKIDKYDYNINQQEKEKTQQNETESSFTKDKNKIQEQEQEQYDTENMVESVNSNKQNQQNMAKIFPKNQDLEENNNILQGSEYEQTINSTQRDKAQQITINIKGKKQSTRKRIKTNKKTFNFQIDRNNNSDKSKNNITVNNIQQSQDHNNINSNNSPNSQTSSKESDQIQSPQINEKEINILSNSNRDNSPDMDKSKNNIKQQSQQLWLEGDSQKITIRDHNQNNLQDQNKLTKINSNNSKDQDEDSQSPESQNLKSQEFKNAELNINSEDRFTGESNNTLKEQDPKEEKKNPDQNLKNKTTWHGLLIPHPFFGIFLAFDEKLPRVYRLIIYYVSLHLLIAISSLFNSGEKDESQWQAFILSLVSAVLLGLPVAILRAMFKKDKKIVRIIGMTITFLILLISCYVILTKAALLGVQKSNKWAQSYFLAFWTDCFIVQIVKNIFVVSIIRKYTLANSQTCIRKIIKNEYVENFFKF